MLKLNNQDRGSGKTTKIIELMEEDELALCLVPYYEIKRLLFPKELQKRVISARSFKMYMMNSRGENTIKYILMSFYILIFLLLSCSIILAVGQIFQLLFTELIIFKQKSPLQWASA
ncbi:hypothetical protein [Lactococcus lactis]|uniref:hypothetical protein n=1 Tax=Lactococcus lactis TaxID=1358 RepID=UPI002659120A|nr:hypothetical protein [Lactococcus lactis]WKG34633.1 hypothetical protein QZH48_09940 [Lactococcus lactis subsp. lactis]